MTSQIGIDGALSELCGDVDAFEHHHWEQRPLRHRNPDLAELFRLEDADRHLLHGSLPAPHHVRLTNKDMRGKGANEQLKERPWARRVKAPGNGDSATVIDPEVALDGFDAGDTIVFHGLREIEPKVDEFLQRLGSEIGHKSGANAYLTPPNSQGLDIHYDNHDVFVVQTHGSKNWEVWQPLVDKPTPTYSPRQHEAEGESERFVLEAGDVLYLPRGWPHRASTAADASMHVTISVARVTYSDILEGVVTALRSVDHLRDALPLGFHERPEELAVAVKEQLMRAADAIAGFDMDAVTEELCASAAQRRRVRPGRLVDLIAANEGGTEQALRRGEAFDKLTCSEAGEWWLTVDDRELALPGAFTEGLSRLSAGETLPAATLAPDLGPAVVAAVIQQLLRHGVITTRGC